MAAEAKEGIADNVGWLLWPSSDDSEAIGHGFGGRSMGCWGWGAHPFALNSFPATIRISKGILELTCSQAFDSSDA